MDQGKSKLITNQIKVYGIVQGVGFRPLVYHIAKKYKIRGYVRNVGGYVEILAQAPVEEMDLFLSELQKDHGNGSEIVKLEMEAAKPDSEEIPRDFAIIDSENSDEVSILPPDLAVCPDCQRELFDEADRRFGNPFISCVACGPRYTVIEKLPYDRDNTTMMDFEMCADCHEEYTSPESRRHHAQTISCNNCGPYLIYRDNSLYTDIEKCKILHSTRGTDDTVSRISREEALRKAAETIINGGIIAVKGIGGYHFVCSPFQEETVVKLRKLKGREEKPFAVMFETVESIREYCRVSEEEERLLQRPARPIVLLYMHRAMMAPSTNRGSIYCGAFLPYTPLQLLLTRECGPLIMTSGNISGRPVIREDQEMLAICSPYLQGVLYHTRRIVRSVDDSVARIIDHKPQLIRRSRGYVPYPVFLNHGEKSSINGTPVIFAAGGDLKAAYCLYQKGAAVVSQYFGDLEEESVLAEYIRSKEDLSGLLKLQPTLAVCDLHPNYHSVHYARELGLPLLQVQHHHAHIASVMAEHDLKEKVIGIAFDGTGYGTDGCIWGGEFLICEGAEYERAAHLAYTPILGGDGSVKDAKKTATCYLLQAGLEQYCEDDRTEVIKAALAHKVNTVLTSSMGRLFDAVASLLNIGQVNRYEGECAADLEREAVLAMRSNRKETELSFAIVEKGEIMELDSGPLMKAICEKRETTETGALALGFHYAVADMILQISIRLRERYGTGNVAISGGVFQNAVLTERTCKLLREHGFTVYYNLAVPPNDGGISLGQVYVGLMKQESCSVGKLQ